MKALLWSLFILFTGVLVFGAAYRTNAKSGQQVGSDTTSEPVAQGSGYRGSSQRPVDETHEPLAEQQQQGGYGRGANAADTAETNALSGSAYGQGARQQADDAPGTQQRLQAEESAANHDIITYSGDVAQVPGAGIDLILATADGEMTIGTGPDYLAGQGFYLTAGESIEVTGFWEDGEFKAVEIVRLADGDAITLRDAYGRPNWSGAVQNQRGGGGRGGRE